MTKDKRHRDEFGDNGFLDKVLTRRKQSDLPSGLRKTFVVFAAIAAVIIIGMIAWGSFKASPTSSEAVPIIRAGDGPVKIAPDDRGGLKVANKNSTIFDTLKTAQDDNKVENLLEDEEAPVQKEEILKDPSGPAPSPPIIEATKPASPADETRPSVTVADDKTMPPQPDTNSEEIMNQDLEPVKTMTEAPSKPVETPKPQPVTEPVTQPVKPATSGGTTYIQLASVKSDADAQKQWAGFKSKNPELAGLSLRVQQADLGEKGIYYRVQAGPLSPDAALSTCSAVKSRGGNCLVAK